MLRAYAVYDTEVGYCQGMNFLAGLLLAYMPNEACAFGGLVVLMQERKLRELYKTDLAQLQVQQMTSDAPNHACLQFVSEFTCCTGQTWLNCRSDCHHIFCILTSIQCHDTLAAQLRASYA